MIQGGRSVIGEPLRDPMVAPRMQPARLAAIRSPVRARALVLARTRMPWGKYDSVRVGAASGWHMDGAIPHGRRAPQVYFSSVGLTLE